MELCGSSNTNGSPSPTVGVERTRDIRVTANLKLSRLSMLRTTVGPIYCCSMTVLYSNYDSMYGEKTTRVYAVKNDFYMTVCVQKFNDQTWMINYTTIRPNSFREFDRACLSGRKNPSDRRLAKCPLGLVQIIIEEEVICASTHCFPSCEPSLAHKTTPRYIYICTLPGTKIRLLTIQFLTKHRKVLIVSVSRRL